MTRLPALLAALLAATVFAVAAGAAFAQDPAYVNGSSRADPLRASAPMPARTTTRGAPLDNGYGVPIAPAAGDRLQEIDLLREQLGRQMQENGQLLPADQRGVLAQLLDQSGSLSQQARGGGAGAGGSMGAGPNPLDFNAVQNDPRVQAGARQAQAAMDALERSLLPMLQDFKNKFDAELARSSANRR